MLCNCNPLKLVQASHMLVIECCLRKVRLYIATIITSHNTAYSKEVCDGVMQQWWCEYAVSCKVGGRSQSSWHVVVCDEARRVNCSSSVIVLGTCDRLYGLVSRASAKPGPARPVVRSFENVFILRNVKCLHVSLNSVRVYVCVSVCVWSQSI